MHVLVKALNNIFDILHIKSTNIRVRCPSNTLNQMGIARLEFRRMHMFLSAHTVAFALALSPQLFLLHLNEFCIRHRFSLHTTLLLAQLLDIILRYCFRGIVAELVWTISLSWYT